MKSVPVTLVCYLDPRSPTNSIVLKEAFASKQEAMDYLRDNANAFASNAKVYVFNSTEVTLGDSE